MAGGHSANVKVQDARDGLEIFVGARQEFLCGSGIVRIGPEDDDVRKHMRRIVRTPLPPASPLWELPNVIVSPHTAALSPHENERIVELFCDNVRRFLDGEPLRNRIDPELFY